MKAKFTSNFFHAGVITMLLALGIFQFEKISAQNGVGINGTGAAADPSAGLDVDYPDKGVLVPRIALVVTSLGSPVTSPATGLLVYNTATVNDVAPGFYYWNGGQWVPVTPNAAPGDTLITCGTGNIYYTLRGDGNGGYVCNPFLQASSSGVAIGTTPSSSYDLRIYGSSANVGIGFSTSSSYALDVDGDVRLQDQLGVGVAPDFTYSIKTSGSISVGGALWCGGTTISNSGNISMAGNTISMGGGTLSMGTGGNITGSGPISTSSTMTANNFSGNYLIASTTSTGTALVRTSSGSIRVTSSTLRVKENINNLVVDKEKLFKTRLVSYNLKKALGGDPDVGVIAEELEKNLPELVNYGPKRTWIGDSGLNLYNPDGSEVLSKTEVEPYGVKYDKFGLYLVPIVAAQDKEIANLKKEVSDLKARLEKQERWLAKLAEGIPDLKDMQGRLNDEKDKAEASAIKK